MKHTLFALFTGLALTACGGASSSSAENSAAEEPHAASGSGSEQGPLVPPGEAGIGDRTTCPVSGEEFVVTESSPHAERDGRTYYFCCPHCAERFQQNPPSES